MLAGHVGGNDELHGVHLIVVGGGQRVIVVPIRTRDLWRVGARGRQVPALRVLGIVVLAIAQGLVAAGRRAGRAMERVRVEALLAETLGAHALVQLAIAKAELVVAPMMRGHADLELHHAASRVRPLHWRWLHVGLVRNALRLWGVLHRVPAEAVGLGLQDTWPHCRTAATCFDGVRPACLETMRARLVAAHFRDEVARWRLIQVCVAFCVKGTRHCEEERNRGGTTNEVTTWACHRCRYFHSVAAA
mmetsp:Transcript_101277/g.285521  ORF Transcript_101277/g.285521 Transcript_101277/m.285521 type:complete len:247 (+) Transcript_101277:2582-3322(+)